MGSEWFRRFAPPGGNSASASRATLVCFPHAGGAASAYLPLARALAPGVGILAAQYPGRQDRRSERPVADIGELADSLAAEVSRELRGTYAFFGHSMGALLAYETARRLRDLGVAGPVRLFLSGRGAPTLHPGRHDRMSTDADVLAAVRRLGGTTPAVLDDPELRQMVMPALRADYRAIGAYAWREGEPLDVPFSVYVGDSDPVVSVAQASAWRDFTTAPTSLDVFPGGHFYLDGQLPALARAVAGALTGDLTAVDLPLPRT
ncbi:alpha/beta fold hydrolase [Streptomyces sp. NBC_01551]|uniref:thioesterase II family protein n=1 Tax=Streptomyces sp. NBC_01551 TaxID=2975876 RepID=UPI002254FA31|nr:thioesterase domain-containing protein [Streptomyces sp. NBC_01551]MCX4526365.1 alpha/beta fold hydrolase [Streptomyces sp. NBC_01551]